MPGSQLGKTLVCLKDRMEDLDRILCGFHRNIHRLYDHCANSIKAHRRNLKLTYLPHRLEA